MNIQQPDVLNIIAGMSLTSLVLLVGHWFPWSRFLGREMHRLEAYVYGTVAILLGFSLVAWLMESLAPVVWLSLVIVAGGSATFSAWALDWLGIKLAATRRQARRARNGHLSE